MSPSTLSFRRRSLEVAVGYADGKFGPIPIPAFDSPGDAESWRAAAHIYVPEWGAEKRPHGTWEYSRDACEQHRLLGARWSVEARARFFALLANGGASRDLESTAGTRSGASD